MAPVSGLIAAVLVAAACLCSPAGAQSDSSKTLQTLFDEYWAWDSRESPEIATARGDDRYNDRVTDLSQAAIDRRKGYRTDLLARLRKVDAASISGQDLVSRDVLVMTLENDVRVGAFHDEWMPVSQTAGPQIYFAYVAKSTPFRNVADYENYLKRMRGLSVQIGQTQALMARGIATGWVWPATAIARVPSQIDAWLPKDVEQNPAYRPFMAFPRDMPAATQVRLANEGRRAVAEEVVPAFRALKTFVEKTYLPAARRDLSVSTLPGGAPY
jgi:uncharacterized protein (DUF885 family)